MKWQACLPAALGLSISASPAAAATLGQAHSLGIDGMRIGAALVLCCLAALAAAVLMRKTLQRGGGLKGFSFKFSAAPQAIAVLETHRLSVHGDLCRIRVAARELVVIVSPGGATVLADTAPPDSGSAQP